MYIQFKNIDADQNGAVTPEEIMAFISTRGILFISFLILTLFIYPNYFTEGRILQLKKCPNCGSRMADDEVIFHLGTCAMRNIHAFRDHCTYTTAFFRYTTTPNSVSFLSCKVLRGLVIAWVPAKASGIGVRKLKGIRTNKNHNFLLVIDRAVRSNYFRFATQNVNFVIQNRREM